MHKNENKMRRFIHCKTIDLCSVINDSTSSSLNARSQIMKKSMRRKRPGCTTIPQPEASLLVPSISMKIKSSAAIIIMLMTTWCSANHVTILMLSSVVTGFGRVGVVHGQVLNEQESSVTSSSSMDASSSTIVKHKPRIVTYTTPPSFSRIVDATVTSTIVTQKVRISPSKDTPIPSPTIRTTVVDSRSSTRDSIIKQQHQPTGSMLKSSVFTAPIPMAYINGTELSPMSQKINAPNYIQEQQPSLSNVSSKRHAINTINIVSISKTQETPPSLDQRQQEIDFLHWCHHTLNITSIVHIQHFSYDKNATSMLHWKNVDMIDDDDDYMNDDVDEIMTEGSQHFKDEVDNDKIWVRGLAASRDIQPGEIIVRIPVHALFSVVSAIDHHPILSPIIGPNERIKNGWNNDEYNKNNNRQTTKNHTNSVDDTIEIMNYHMYEIPLLAIALLYHCHLGLESPIYQYVQVLIHSPIDHLPYVWTKRQWKDHLQHIPLSSLSSSLYGVFTVAKEIRHEIKYMYNTVVSKLIKDYPDVFGPNSAIDPNTKEWMFSFPKFQWAYAIVHSRHWQLPKEAITTQNDGKKDLDKVDHQKPHRDIVSSVNSNRQHHTKSNVADGLDQVPPADTPTESWILEHGDVDDVVEEEQNQGLRDSESDVEASAVNHSFLAPVADLLNFGPPCTRVKYNAVSHTFDTIATCAFQEGQEITFWYSNECTDVMMGLYGFTHPLISPCPTAEELLSRVYGLERKLYEALNELEFIDGVIEKCDCSDLINDAASEGKGPELNNDLSDSTNSNQYIDSVEKNGSRLRHLDEHNHKNNNPSTMRTSKTTIITDTPTISRSAKVSTKTETQNGNDHEPNKESHLLIRRTRRWSQTSEF